MNERSKTMSKEPLSKEFKARLATIIKLNYLTETDRKTIETYFKVYFDGYKPPQWHLLEADEMEALEQYRQSRTTK
ncbi:MAG: hypothetical protein IKI09_01655 [Bacteroidales bacterium]|jgi:hypothetical protein|nr:hypothetical protein [Bacteroidales bacterium]